MRSAHRNGVCVAISGRRPCDTYRKKRKVLRKRRRRRRRRRSRSRSRSRSRRRRREQKNEVERRNKRCSRGKTDSYVFRDLRHKTQIAKELFPMNQFPQNNAKTIYVRLNSERSLK